jgi:hypothetical protein
MFFGASFFAVHAASGAVSIKPIALSGTQAAGYPSGALYTLYAALPSLDSVARVMFNYYVTDPVHSHAWWVTGPDGIGPAPLVRFRDPAAGSPGYMYWGGSPSDAKLGDGGGTAFRSYLAAADATTFSEVGVFVGVPGDIRLAARTGVPMPELGGGTFDTSIGTDLVSNGSTTVFTSWAYPSSHPSGTRGMWMASSDGSLKTLALAGGVLDTEMLLMGVDQNDHVGVLSNSGRMYVVSESGVVPAPYPGRAWGDRAVYTASGAWVFVNAPARTHVYKLAPDKTLTSIAAAGDQAPGMPAGVTYRMSDEITASRSARNIIFRSALVGPGIYDTDPMTMFASIDGEVRLLSRPGLPAPQLGPDVLFWHFPAAAVNDAGQVLLWSLLQGPGVTTANRIAMWYDDGDGVMRLLLRAGDPFSFDGMTKTVLSFDTPGAASGSTGRDTFNNSGQFVCSINFTDGSSGVFLFQIPEPSGALLALAGVAVLWGRGARRSRGLDRRCVKGGT